MWTTHPSGSLSTKVTKKNRTARSYLVSTRLDMSWFAGSPSPCSCNCCWHSFHCFRHSCTCSGYSHSCCPHPSPAPTARRQVPVAEAGNRPAKSHNLQYFSVFIYYFQGHRPTIVSDLELVEKWRQMQKTAVTVPHLVQQIKNSSIEEHVRFLVRILLSVCKRISSACFLVNTRTTDKQRTSYCTMSKQ
jgi:hypothetical protein